MALLKYILIVVLFLSIVHVAHASTLYTVPSQDASVNQYNHTVNYNGVYLYIGYDQNTRLYESLIEFDPETYISSNANITGANITMYVDTCGTLCAGNVPIRRFSGNWWESNVTWDTKPATSGIVGYINLSSGAGLKYTSTDITMEIQGIINGSYNNYGFSFIPAYTGPNNISYIHSGEGLTPQPSLNIEYWIPPSTPTISSPTGVTLSPINLTWNASTDIDGEAITYYYQIANDSSFTDIVSQGSTSNIYSGSIALGNTSYYARVNASDAHGSSPWSSTLNFAVGYPTLFYPANGSTITSTYPPFTTNINFTWSQLAGAGNNLIVARDSAFNLIIVDTTTTNNFSVQGLESGTYYWNVRYYNISSGVYYGTSDTFTFTISANITEDGTTGIHGTVYELVDGVLTPISGAKVRIWNNESTTSQDMVAGSNGYYLFNNLSNLTTYYIQASKQDAYEDSAIEIVTTGSGTWTTKNILMQKCVSGLNCFYNSHYVKFIVSSVLGTKYQNVAATVYTGSAVTASFTGTTDSMGSVTFFLVKDQQYRLTFINSSQGINKEITVTPHDDEYWITIWYTDEPWQDYDTQIKDAINITVTTRKVNSTHAYVNVTYIDSLTATTSLSIYLNQTNQSDITGAQNTMSSYSGASNSLNQSFLVSNYSAQFYYVHLLATHGTYGTIDRTFGVQFEKTTGYDGLSDTFFLWFAIGTMFFFGAIFTGKTAEQGVIIVCGMGWIYLALGFFNAIDETLLAIALSVASIIGIMAYFSNRNKRMEASY